MRRGLVKFFSVLAACVFASGQVFALTSAQKSLFDTGIYYFDAATSGYCTADSTSASSPASSSDINSVVSKYSLQSAIVMQLGGQVVDQFHSSEHPVTPASTMKLIIADVALREKLDLAKSVSVTSDVFYDGSNDLKVSNISLGGALYKMLNQSSNTGANVMMKAIGGTSSQATNVRNFTSKAQGYGYKDTSVGGYYDSANDGKNDSTIADEANAMNHIFSSQGDDYSQAQKALREASGPFGTPPGDNYYDVADEANKWAGTSKVAGNVSLVKAAGLDYIVGVYINADSGSSSTKAVIKNSIADIVSGLSSQSSGNAATPVTSCCDSAATTIPGDNPADKVWNFFIGKGLSNVQVAGIMGNLQIESGFDPTVIYGGQHSTDPASIKVAWGLGQWLPGSRILGIQQKSGVKGDVTKLETQLQIMWWEVNNTAPTAQQHIIDGLKQLNDAAAVAAYWQLHYEGSTGQADDARVRAALEWVNHVASQGNSVDTSSSCSSASSSSIVQEAIKLSWTDGSHGTTPTDAYRAAYEQFNPKGPGLADCGGFVATVMHATNADPSYPAGGTSAQETYVKAHPEKYDIQEGITSTKYLQPGDILIVNAGTGEGASGHTLIYIGPQPPNNYDEASASLGTRAANLGKLQLNDSRGLYMRARLK